MKRRLVLVLCLAFCAPVALAQSKRQEKLDQYRRLLKSYDCADRIVGVQGLLDEVPPQELFDSAWECAEAEYADPDTRRAAREAVRKLVSRRDTKMVPTILATLKQLGGRDGSDLISGISSIEPAVKEAVPVIAALLDSGNDATRRAAAKGLGRMKTAALPAVPRLVDVLLGERDQETRVVAAEALGEIGPSCAKQAVPALAKAAKEDKWPKVRSASLTALGEMGPAAKEAIPVLRESLKDPDGWISGAATRALFRVEPGKSQEVADIADAARPVQKGVLYDDLSQMQTVLTAKVPEVFELAIYPEFAMATTACRDTSSGRCTFTYKGGAVTGPDDGSGDCEKKIQLSKVDFSVVPGLVKQAPGLLGKPEGKVDMVNLTPGVFCKSHGWNVSVKDAGMVLFKINGKVDKTLKY